MKKVRLPCTCDGCGKKAKCLTTEKGPTGWFYGLIAGVNRVDRFRVNHVSVNHEERGRIEVLTIEGMLIP